MNDKHKYMAKTEKSGIRTHSVFEFTDETHKIASFLEDDEELSFDKRSEILGLDKHQDFKNADLTGCDFTNSDLRYYDFSGSDLSDSVGINITMDGTTKLDDAILENSVFSPHTEARNLPTWAYATVSIISDFSKLATRASREVLAPIQTSIFTIFGRLFTSITLIDTNFKKRGNSGEHNIVVLTTTELKILELLAQNKKMLEIGKILHRDRLSMREIVSQIVRKLAVGKDYKDADKAVIKAKQLGLID